MPYYYFIIIFDIFIFLIQERCSPDYLWG